MKTLIKKWMSVIPRRPIKFENLKTDPISRQFGFDRGTPIDRYYIDTFLQKNAGDIQGRVLEVAENTYSRRFGSNISSYEVLHYDNSNKNATIIGDLTEPETLPENAIDCFICTQTFNFIYDIQNAVTGCYRLLCDGGVLLCTVSGLSQISRYDMERWGDYWRFTDLSARKLFESVFNKDKIEIMIYGNVLAANTLLQGLAVEDLPNKHVLDKYDNDYQVTIGIKAVK
jgi:SAM-dependent methyltransferase